MPFEQINAQQMRADRRKDVWERSQAWFRAAMSGLTILVVLYAASQAWPAFVEYLMEVQK